MHATMRNAAPRPAGAANVKKVRGASEIDHEARSAAEIMRSDLKTQPPWSRDVEQQRQKSRNLYLTILFSHPLSTHAQSLEPLWHNTTYNLITSYRTLITRLESSLPQTQPPSRKPNPSQIEYKKILTRFRQLLISEESFYRGLATRLVRFHSLQNVTRGYLSEVGLIIPEGGVGEDGLAPEEVGKEKVGLVFKALICLGDIERYRVQYDEKVRREMREGKDALGGREVFVKAWGYYEAARGLNPDDGSAFNQMAVISTYQVDDFLTLYNYVRALAIKNAFKNVDEILEKFLRRAGEKNGKGLVGGIEWEYDESEVAEVLEEMKRVLIGVVSGIYRRSRLDKCKEAIPLFLHYLGELLRNRSLPSESVVKIAVVLIGIHWHARQSSSIVAPGSGDESGARREAEELALYLLLQTMGLVFDVSSAEIREGLKNRSSGTAIVDEDEELELHQYISAVFRRLLPTLRIISKWIKLHTTYLSRFPEATSLEFWSRYGEFVNGLASLFPMESLPGCHEVLEEDVDMRGFTPLMRGLSGVEGGEEKKGDGEVHPNEQQLMRIADLQVDARLLIQPSVNPLLADEIASVSTETEDDPVNMAMRATLGGSSTEEEEEDDEEEDEEEVILWGNRPSSLTPGYNSSPAHNPVAPKPQATAYDLLQNLMLDGVPPAQAQTPPTPPATTAPRRSSAQQNANTPGQSSPGLLFGGDKTGGNIWTMTREESDRGVKRSLAAKDVAAIWGEPVTNQPHSPAPLPGQQARPSLPASNWVQGVAVGGGFGQQPYAGIAGPSWGYDGSYGATQPGGSGYALPATNGGAKWQSHYPG